MRLIPDLGGKCISLVCSLASLSVGMLGLPPPAHADTVVPTCPAPFTFDHALGECTHSTTARCPAGSVFDHVWQKCRTKIAPNVCPPGHALNAKRKWCLPTGQITGGFAPSCPAEYSFQPSTGYCIRYSPLSCPSGYTSQPSTPNLCVKIQQPICPSGYRYSATRKLCATGAINQ